MLHQSNAKLRRKRHRGAGARKRSAVLRENFRDFLVADLGKRGGARGRRSTAPAQRDVHRRYHRIDECSTPITNALAGFRTLLGQLWPCPSNLANCGTATNGNVANPVDEAALMVFPPVTNASQATADIGCTDPQIATTYSGVSDDYQRSRDNQHAGLNNEYDCGHRIQYRVHLGNGHRCGDTGELGDGDRSDIPERRGDGPYHPGNDDPGHDHSERDSGGHDSFVDQRSRQDRNNVEKPGPSRPVI